MIAYNYHICLVSEQNVPEMLGALIPETGTGKLHAIVTSKMRVPAKNLQRSCEKKGIDCALHSLDSHNNIEEIVNLLNSIIQSETPGNWAVNITGGTKLMALAVFEWAKTRGFPAFYIDTADKTIHIYDNNKWVNAALPDLLNYNCLLSLYGYNIIEQKKLNYTRKLKESLEKMAQVPSMPEGMNAIHTLNRIIQEAEFYNRSKASYPSSPALRQMFDACAICGKLTLNGKNVCFTDRNARLWCKGLWLEDYVASVLEDMRRQRELKSVSASIKISDDASENELDAVFTKDNRLHIVECKTMNNKSLKTLGTLYKADSLRGRIGGIFAKFMICSIDPLSEKDQNRADKMGIRTVTGPELKNLSNILLAWTNQ